MKIDVSTAVDGCGRFCPEFEIETITLYGDGKEYARVYKCPHTEQCAAMLEAMSTTTIEIENIT